ncbi:hypothetical protein [Hahella sp. HN01]|uniref:hypothetical protein n=1 Tax=Hahella sp. HN01 TaxID=2847262 RepID=UPI001C1ECA81|nr:hypothetical protein [Hahella sp. HN01]MBU6955574.1 hypothetical protein [Hahella sp. HN01]
MNFDKFKEETLKGLRASAESYAEMILSEPETMAELTDASDEATREELIDEIVDTAWERNGEAWFERFVIEPGLPDDIEPGDLMKMLRPSAKYREWVQAVIEERVSEG